uniref:NADH-ubiquinone oxidoreductase chain 6 n=1 Tax=Hypothenemus sp. BMNH 1039866 TaxID=1903766 RepID=A0A343A5P5_9CUCU|nr:NADH dehydrogenase subunit 6 [Hypothenemus sp. BMNH 1039866]
MTIIMMSYISFMILTLKHPLSLSVTLIVQALLAAITTGLFFNQLWYGFIMFLVMVGGVMILFVYMTSMASSEKFSSPSPLKFTSIMMTIILMTMLSTKKLNIKSNAELTKTFMEYFNSEMMQMMIFLMIYLFIALIAVVKISDKREGTFRQS